MYGMILRNTIRPVHPIFSKQESHEKF